jgi:predicted MPP superfamily phosphohydrolase
VVFRLLLFVVTLQAADFRFVILGDRTGETQPGVYEQVWKQAAADHPAFVITVGDTIQGGDDSTAHREWREVKKLWPPIVQYLTPGNHDIWSELSESLYIKYSGHPVHYSFDRDQAHFTILDNSRDDNFSAEELVWLESDLRGTKKPLKVVFSHRPSWLIRVLLKNPQDPVHQLAKKYGVHYVVSGHVHQMIHSEFEGVTYLSMPSAGGHLRGTMKYEDGWFFAHTLVEVSGENVQMKIKEMNGRVTDPKDWGPSGLVSTRRLVSTPQ